MSFLVMDDATYIDGLIGIYELNNIALLKEIYIDSYLASAEKHRVLRAEIDNPAKAALSYREFVREAVRFSVLTTKAFKQDEIIAMAKQHKILEAEREAVIDYIHQQFSSLHEGNLIRYRLKLDDLTGIDLS